MEVRACLLLTRVATVQGAPQQLVSKGASAKDLSARNARRAEERAAHESQPFDLRASLGSANAVRFSFCLLPPVCL